MVVPHPRFVSEAIRPSLGAFDTLAMSRGEPGLPAEFAWRGDTLRVGRVLRRWRSTSEDRGEKYLARHWFEFESPPGRRAVVYFDRRAKREAARWWLYTIEE
ncbi:MAG: hypothetical protein NVS1B14_10010 [Vulcanimicrobiaceae bacterium]